MLTQLQCSYQPAATSQPLCKVQSGQMQLQPRRQLPGSCCSSCRSRVTWLGTGAQQPCCNRQGWRGGWRGVKLAVKLCFGDVKCVGCQPQALVILRSDLCTCASFASCSQAFIKLVYIAMPALHSLESIWQSAELQVLYRAAEQKPYVANAGALRRNTIATSCVYHFCWLLLMQDHYKGYKHQRVVARHKAALHSQSYHRPHSFDSSPRRMPFTPSHHPPGPHPSDAGFLSPARSPYSHSADRWSRGYAAMLHPCLVACQ